MIDTISIRLITDQNKKRFEVLPRAQFIPEFTQRSFSDLSEKERSHKNSRVHYLRKFILHPELPEDAPYVPQVEIFETVDIQNRSVAYELKITGSLPILMFGNNLQELNLKEPSIYTNVRDTLIKRLHHIGIVVNPWNLRDAPLSVLHISKNIELPVHIKLRQILQEMTKLDMGTAYDTSSTGDATRIRNGNSGQVINIRAGTREWAFYDKVADILKPKSRSVDKRKMKIAKEFVYANNLTDTEVFRAEYRLNKAQTIRSEVNKVLRKDYSVPVTFSDIFDDQLTQKLLLNAWHKLLQRPENQLALFKSKSKYDLLVHILNNAQKKDKSAHSQNCALWVYGLASLMQDIDAKTVKDEVGKIWSSKAEGRLKEKIHTAANLLQELPFSEGMQFIMEKLEEYKCYDPAQTQNDL